MVCASHLSFPLLVDRIHMVAKGPFKFNVKAVVLTLKVFNFQGSYWQKSTRWSTRGPVAFLVCVFHDSYIIELNFYFGSAKRGPQSTDNPDSLKEYMR